jgi:cobalt-precorrin 5A hydrolase
MIVAGFGFTSSATTDSFEQALNRTGLAERVDLLATPADKAQQPAITEFARNRSLQINPIQPSALHAAQTETQSPLSRLLRRTGSVAEAAALAAAGPGATLIVTRQISQDRMATCAIAKGADT